MTRTWWQIIDEAEARYGFTEEEQDLSCDWVTCACGQQDPCIPRIKSGEASIDGSPVDPTLGNLGVVFASKVGFSQFKKARKTLAAIERRASRLLAEMEVGK